MKELTLKELQAVSLDILKDVDAFCKEKGIRYSLAYGTLLGAVRHKGFIPWDDDIDIVMLREDYDRFCREYASEKYSLFSPSNTEDYYLAFARVADMKDTESRTYIPWCGKVQDQGVWIDIFPLDYAPDNEEEHNLQYKMFRSLYELSNKVRKTRVLPLPGLPLKFHIKRIAHGRRFNRRVTRQSPEQVAAWLDFLMRRLCSSPTGHLSQFGCPDCNIREWLKAEDFASFTSLPFEDASFSVMSGYESVLREWFGDYMQLPPENQRVWKSSGYLRFYWKRKK